MVIGQGQYASQDAHVVAPIVIGLVTLVVVALWQTCIDDRALLHPRLFKGTTSTFLLPSLVSRRHRFA